MIQIRAMNLDQKYLIKRDSITILVKILFQVDLIAANLSLQS